AGCSAKAKGPPTLGKPTPLGVPMPSHSRPVAAIAASSDGKLVFTATRPPDELERETGTGKAEPGVHVWELATGKLVRAPGGTDVSAMAGSVAALEPSGTLNFWNDTGTTLLWTFQVGTDARWVGVGKLPYTVGRHGRVATWNTRTQKQQYAFETKLDVDTIA